MLDLHFDLRVDTRTQSSRSSTQTIRMRASGVSGPSVSSGEQQCIQYAVVW
jgi:hypothetical protein